MVITLVTKLHGMQLYSLANTYICYDLMNLKCAKIPIFEWIHYYFKPKQKRLRWSRGSVLAFGTQVRGFAPGQSRRIFTAKKILSTPSFGGEVKPSVPCRSFTACKRSLNVTCKMTFRQNLLDISRPQFHLPPLGALAWWHAWRRLVAKFERLTKIAQ